MTTIRSEQAAGAKPFARLRAIAAMLILAILTFFVVQTFICLPYVIGQDSMEPTLLSGESVLVDRLTPNFDDYSRGELVVFRPPTSEFGDTPFIKRVIGLPGDVVQLGDGAVFVNGVRLVEPYALDQNGLPLEPGQLATFERLIIPPATLFVMGDHRGSSVDSRSFGPVPRGDVIGRVVLRYSPSDKFGVLETPTYPNVPAAP